MVSETRSRAVRAFLPLLLSLSILPLSADAQEGRGGTLDAARALSPEAAAALAPSAAVPPPRPPPDLGRGHRLSWPENKRRAGWTELVTTSAYVGGLLGFRAIDYPGAPRWSRENSFDRFMRDRMIVSERARGGIARASDGLLYALVAYPVVVEDLSLVLLGDRNPGLAGQLLAIDAQAFALAGLLVGVTKVGAGRERPTARAAGCGDHPNAPACTAEDRNGSFFSGHAAMAFTGASLVCFHQQQVPNLYGSRAAGIGVCASAMTLATTTAAFRVMADKHWTTDVLVGAGVGIFSGWLLPWLMHGRTFLDVEGERVRGSFSPMLDRTTYGLGFQGTF